MNDTPTETSALSQAELDKLTDRLKSRSTSMSWA